MSEYKITSRWIFSDNPLCFESNLRKLYKEINMIPFKVKLVGEGKEPIKATEFSSGWDLYARIERGATEFGESYDWKTIRPGENMLIPVGFCMEIPPGYEGVIRPRSGMAKEGIVCSIGTIDSDYRGELSVNLFNHSWKHYSVKNGQRIGQLVIQAVVDTELSVVTELSDTDRGPRGFGSSGA
jgi:dUTP pyrophosphatase